MKGVAVIAYREHEEVIIKGKKKERGYLRHKAYNTYDPAIAMRRFFAERGDKIWQMPVKIHTRRLA